MSDSWKLDAVDEEECPIPDEFWHIEFADGTYDRISKFEADQVIGAVQKGEGWLWVNTLSGSRVFINTKYVIFLGMNTTEIRRVDRMHTRWFAYEAKKDPYLKQVNDDD